LQINTDKPGRMCSILDAHQQEFSKELKLLRGEHNLNYSNFRHKIRALKHSLDVIMQILCTNLDKSAKANRELQDTLWGAFDRAENVQETVIQQSAAMVWLCQTIDALSVTVSRLETRPPPTPRLAMLADGFCPINRLMAPLLALGTPTAPPKDSTQHVTPTVKQPRRSDLDCLVVADKPLNLSRGAWAIGPGRRTSAASASTQAPQGASAVPVGRRTLAPWLVEDADSHAPPPPIDASLLHDTYSPKHAAPGFCRAMKPVNAYASHWTIGQQASSPPQTMLENHCFTHHARNP
jgi:hypothetical protein